MSEPQLSRFTRALRTGVNTDPAQGAIVPPIYLSTNFSFEALGHPRAYDYTRSGNPTRDLLGEALATMERGFGGTITSTGMSANTLVIEALTSLGARVLVPHDCYGGTWRLFTYLTQLGRVKAEFIDLTNPEALESALASGPAPEMIWIETPSNPLLRITDLDSVTAAAQRVGAISVVDNTFCSPLLQRPIEHGADVVVHSTTKFINGHSDVVGGAAIARTEETHLTLRNWANALGLTGSPFDAYLTLRGLRTLDARMRVHQENTAAVVDTLLDHPAVASVNYPGLPEHPNHEIAARQQDGFGALLSFELKGGYLAVQHFVEGLHCFDLAESLGGVESLIAHPATMTHASMTPEARDAAGIRDGLLRLSVGIEGKDDLVADIEAGLERACS